MEDFDVLLFSFISISPQPPQLIFSPHNRHWETDQGEALEARSGAPTRSRSRRLFLLF